ncbi:MAG: LCP family protein [Cyanobacteria bacterium P01_H01_bin.121]
MWATTLITAASLLSATAGALLAVSLSSTPLLQRQLTAAESAVFSQGGSIVDEGLNLQLPRLTRPVNILVLGTKILSSDLNDPPPEVQNLGYHALVNSFEGLTDTMLLLRFDPDQQQVTVLSIPRDTRAYVNGYGLTKINEANLYGGPALAAQSVSELLDGVGIDRYLLVNVQGVEKLINALGGVNVNVPQDMKYQDDSQHLYINLKAGEQHLDGDKALQFLRFRYDNYGDIGRIQRQQLFMRAMVEQTLKPATISRLPNILSVVRENLDTNLSVEELFALTGFASQADRENVQMLMLPGDFGNMQDYEVSYWLPRYTEIDMLVDQYFGANAFSANYDSVVPYVRIAVQDSTGQTEAVDRVLDSLYNSGYSNVFVDYARDQALPITRIIAQNGDRQAAEAVRQALGIGEVLIESTGNLDSDVTIQIGRDWLRQSQSALLP